MQCHLQEFDMSNAGFSVENGIRILQALTSGCRYNLHLYNLAIEDFFETRRRIFADRRFLQHLATFRRLANLSVNYNYLSDDVLTLLIASTAPTLVVINIKVYRYDPHDHKLSTQLWRQLKQAAPKLSVSIYFEGIGDYETMHRVLLPDMPVVAIQVWTGLRRPDEEWQMGRALRHIADSYAKTLGTYWRIHLPCIY